MRKLVMTRLGILFACGIASCASDKEAANGASPPTEIDAPGGDVDDRGPEDAGAATVNDGGKKKPRPDASTDAGVAEESPDGGAPVSDCATEQIYTLMTASQKKALVQQFVARNGSAWAPATVSVDVLTASVDGAERTDPPGKGTATVDTAEAAGIAFLQANWDLLGFRTAAGPGTIKGAFDLDDGTPGFYLQFDSTEIQAGYEHVKNGELWMRFRMRFGTDGKLRSFAQVALTTFPKMTMAPYPTLSPTALRAKINGLTIGNTGVTITPADAVKEVALELIPVNQGQALFVDYSMQRNGGTYTWKMNPCTLYIVEHSP